MQPLRGQPQTGSVPESSTGLPTHKGLQFASPYLMWRQGSPPRDTQTTSHDGIGKSKSLHMVFYVLPLLRTLYFRAYMSGLPTQSCIRKCSSFSTLKYFSRLSEHMVLWAGNLYECLSHVLFPTFIHRLLEM